MSRLSSGEREFLSDFGDVTPPAGAPARPGAAPAAAPAAKRMPSGTQEIDARGVSPPLPLLRAHRALRGMQPGQELRIITSYAQSMAEFQSLARHVVGYELISQDVVGEEFVHVLKRRR
jgi:tRNA 2-thiouridine synthesizing protein A